MEEDVSQLTVRFADYIYGIGGPAIDDPAETFHEASKNNRNWPAPNVIGRQLLEENPQVRRSARRSTFVHSQRPRIALPPAAIPTTSLATAMTERRSTRSFGTAPIALSDLSGVLLAAYGHLDAATGRRITPSGGALYPLEVYLLARSVEDLPPGLFHFDPFRQELEIVNLDDGSITDAAADALVSPELAHECGLLLIITAVFWRSRFKYGLRGYRFCLTEAGHLMQNVLLFCAAAGLAVVPLGGYVDAAIDNIVGADGVNESALYVAAIGTSAQ